ncbi:Ankyrin repeat protein [Giardia duodenalis]|uniref:Ankyrin repeat protein n=1 Tax=Giardia intestinalis TaxID=5741 RepID=V6TWN8_GIAIN|nr:Ankyrin repeat protein [Giardia intestinalis]
MSKVDSKEWFTAIGARRYTQVRELLDIYKGTRNSAQDTGLMVAARIDDPELATILAVQEAGLVNKSDETALIIAAQLDHPKICEILAPLEKTIYYKDGRSALMIAAEAGSMNACLALAREFPVERDPSGYTALDYSVISNNIACTRAIVDLVHHSQEDFQCAMDLAERDGRSDIYTYLQMALRKQTMKAEEQEIEMINATSATVANSSAVRAAHAPLHRSGSTPMKATLNRNEIRARSSQKSQTGMRAQTGQSPSHPKHSQYSNNTFHSPAARAVSASGLNNSTAVMNMQISLSGSTAGSSQLRTLSPGSNMRERAQLSELPITGVNSMLSGAEHQVIQKNAEVRELFDQLKNVTDLRSSSLINQLQKYVANLHMDYDRVVHEKIQIENSLTSTAPRRSVSPATVIEQVDGPGLLRKGTGRLITSEGEEISPERLTEMKKAAKDAEQLRDEVKRLEGEKRTLDVCVNNLTEALQKLKEDNAIMVRNAQRFANFSRGSNSGSEDQIYDKRRPSTEDTQSSVEYRAADSLATESTPIASQQEDRSRSVERQHQSVENRLREEIRRLQEDLAKASKEASSAIDVKTHLERQISEINDKAMEYQAQAEQANAQKTDAMKEKLAVEEKLLELQEEMLEMREGLELQMRDDEQSGRRKVSELEEANRILISENENLISQLSEIQHDGGGLKHEVSQLTAQLQEAHAQIADLNNVVDELSSRNVINTSNSEEKRLRETLTAREDDLLRAQVDIESLNALVSNQQAQIEELETKLANTGGATKFGTTGGKKSNSTAQNKRGPPTNLRGETQSLYEEFATRSRSELKASAAAQASILARSQNGKRSGSNLAMSRTGEKKYLYTSQGDSVGNASNSGTALRDYAVDKAEHTTRPVSRTKFLSLTLIPPHMSAQQILSMRENLDTTCISTANNRKTDLMEAAEAGDPTHVWKFLNYQAGLQDEEGKTALMYAAQKGHVDIVKALIQKEARIQTHFGTTALMDAACNGHTDIVSILVDYEGGMATKGDENGESAGLTALMLAAHEGHLDCVHILIRKENNMVCSNGMTARDFAKTDEIRNLLDAFQG